MTVINNNLVTWGCSKCTIGKCTFLFVCLSSSWRFTHRQRLCRLSKVCVFTDWSISLFTVKTLCLCLLVPLHWSREITRFDKGGFPIGDWGKCPMLQSTKPLEFDISISILQRKVSFEGKVLAATRLSSNPCFLKDITNNGRDLDSAVSCGR